MSSRQRHLVMVIFLSFSLCTTATISTAERKHIFDLEIISLMPYNVTVGVALPVTGAALHMALKNVQTVYSRDLNVTLTLLYRMCDTKCDSSDANAALLLAEHYNTKALGRCVAVIASACAGVSSTPFLAKEWDVLLFSNALVSTEVFDPTNAPSSVALAGSYEGLAIALLKLFTYFKWWHVAMLLDPNAVSECYRMTMQAVFHILTSDRVNYSGFSIDKYTFRPEDEQSMKEVVLAASQRSRVFLVLGHTMVAIKLLRMARDSRIIHHTADYVFVVIQPIPTSVYGGPTLFTDSNVNDTDLFRSVIYMTTYGVSVNGSDELNRALVRQQEADYGTVQEQGIKPLDLYPIRDTYNSVELFAQLVNESRATSDNGTLTDAEICSGRKLRSLTVNRTFSFQSGMVHFDNDGLRFADILLYSFQPSNRSMEITGRYNSASQSYTWDSHITMEWPAGVPPLDIPACGFSGFDGPCKELPVNAIVSLGLPLILTVAVALLVGAILIVGKLHIHDERETQWWRLPENSLGLDVNINLMRHLGVVDAWL